MKPEHILAPREPPAPRGADVPLIAKLEQVDEDAARSSFVNTSEDQS